MRLVLLAPALLLAACDGSGTGTTVSITANGTDANAQMAALDGGTGKVKVDVPGFEGTFKLPKIDITADKFDLNGVHLPPGSKISGINVDAKGNDDGNVRVAFDSPGGAEAVRGWFAERLPKAGFTIHPDGSGLSGTTDEKKPFALKLDDAAGRRAKGTITIG